MKSAEEIKKEILSFETEEVAMMKYRPHENCGGEVIDGQSYYIPLGEDTVLEIIKQTCAKCGAVIIGQHQRIRQIEKKGGKQDGRANRNFIIEQCQKQGLSFKQMDILLMNLSVQLQDAKKELTKSIVEEAKVKFKPF